MNIIKKYWESAYAYILLLSPGLCMCAGTYWTISRVFGLYSHVQWLPLIVFDCTHIIYLSIALYFIWKNKKEKTYILDHINYAKAFVVITLFIQYNFILYLFASVDVWECTVIFYTLVGLLFDSKLMVVNVIAYGVFLLIAHLLCPEEFLPLGQGNITEIINYRILMYVCISLCLVAIVYLAEHFLAEARKSNEQNTYLMQKQLKYYKDMELMDKELRKFRHDIRNHFMCMEALLNKGMINELEDYFKDLYQNFSFQEKVYFSGNEIIDTILNHELAYNCRDNMKVTVYGSLPKLETVSPMDLCTLFSNLLSNAISSASQCTEVKTPQLIVHFSGGKAFFCIEISNSVMEEKVTLKYRRKDRNHGHGIYKIRDVIEKYEGRYELKMENEMLNVKIYLPI